MSSFGLVNLPPELKALSPFLQRADELKKQQPVMAYWCLYHAAQVGLALKPANTTFLYKLLEVLEKTKVEIGPNDALDVEGASIAYVENFALTVFSAADDEDRRGAATRSTAKKFLAAANFLEVLEIFPKSEVSETIDEKIRYAKWKAADIAKAFRENRKPTPGPPGSEAQPAPEFAAPPDVYMSPPSNLPGTSSMDVDRAKEPPRTPPPGTPGNLIGPGDTELGSTPSKWSTAATPGTPRHDVDWNEQPNTPTKKGAEATGNEDLRGIIGTEEVHITPSDLGQHPLPSVGSPPIGPPSVNFPGTTGASPDSLPQPPPAFSPEQINPSFLPEHAGQNISPFALSPSMGPLPDHALPPPAVTHYPTSHLATSSSSSDPFASIPNPPTASPAPRLPPFHPPAPAPYHMPSAPPLPPPPPPLIPRVAPPDTVELTPALISKAQKHCRFAISSLDYEDGEQAKKELRAALALLEG